MDRPLAVASYLLGWALSQEEVTELNHHPSAIGSEKALTETERV